MVSEKLVCITVFVCALVAMLALALLQAGTYCEIRGDTLYSSAGNVKLEKQFSTRHDCRAFSFTNKNETLSYEYLKVGNWGNEPSYMVDSEGRFVKWKFNNDTLIFIPHQVGPNEETHFYAIYGADKNVTVLFIGKMKYTYKVLGG